MKGCIMGYVRKYSYIIFPLLMSGTFLVLHYCNVVSVDAISVGATATIAGTLLGVLLTVFTIYVAFPRTSAVYKRISQSGHDRIFKLNIIVGSLLFIATIIIATVGVPLMVVTAVFLGGLPTIGIALYYIYKLSGVLQKL